MKIMCRRKEKLLHFVMVSHIMKHPVQGICVYITAVKFKADLSLYKPPPYLFKY